MACGDGGAGIAVAAQRKRGPKPAQERVARLLVMLPWLMEREEVPIAEMAAHFAMSEDELVRDLELAAMCGVGPGVEDMIEVVIDGPTASVGVKRFFERPLRLLRQEAFALVAAAEAASVLPGADESGALSRALDKVRERLGAVVDVADRTPPFTEVVQRAAGNGEILEITYWTASRDEVTVRRIIPRLVFVEDGDFFVLADDERSGSERHFRIDRIHEVHETGERVPLRNVEPRVGDWFAEANDVRTAVLRLDPPAHWVAERYPLRRRTDLGDGRCEVELSVASEEWLARLLLRVGVDGEVVAPQEWQDLGRRTAHTLLARYGESA